MSTKKKLRERVLNKFGGRCAYCGIVLDGRWHIDHMIPIRRCLSTGKPTNPEHDVEDNLYPSCISCNMDKGSIPLEDWRWLISNKIKVLNRDVKAYSFAKRYGLVEETNKEVVFYFEKIKVDN